MVVIPQPHALQRGRGQQQRHRLSQHRGRGPLMDALRRITWLQRPLMRYRVIRSLVWLTEARCRVAAGAGASDSRLLALCARLDAEGAPTCTAWAAGLRVAAAGADASPTARTAAQSAFLAEGHVLLAAALDGPAALNALGVPRPEVVARGTLGMV